jgi:hypothetical protein
MLRVGSVVMGASDVRRAARFWMAALGYVPRDAEAAEEEEADEAEFESEAESETDWLVLVPPPDSVGGPRLSLGRSETPVQDRPRVHLDLYAGDKADQEAEVERLVSLGATRVPWDLYPEDADFIVLADTEGNRFCVIDTARG